MTEPRPDPDRRNHLKCMSVTGIDAVTADGYEGQSERPPMAYSMEDELYYGLYAA